MRLLLASLLTLLTMTQALAHEFQEGQVWSYRTRAGEETSTLLINKVEHDARLGRIFHISISKVKVRNRRAPGGVTHELPHSPVSQLTLDQSVLKLLRSSPPNPDYLAGYATWKQAFDAGQAGVFTLPVAEIVSTIEQAVNAP